MIKKVDRKEERNKRHKKSRKHLKGTNERPRLCVFISNKNIEVQIIDDISNITLVSASTLQKENKVSGKNIEAGRKMGEIIAKKALDKDIKTVVFDRGGRIYHGVVKALAEAAREGGLEF